MPEIPDCLLVDLDVTLLHAISVDSTDRSLSLHMSTTSPTALCPACHQPATRVHSRYQRHLADLPWAQCPVALALGVRRFFCDTADCPQHIFTERLPTVAAPWARRTRRLAAVQQQLGCIAGGAAGAALATALGCPAGVDLLLTLVRQRALPDPPTPRVLGVDDWARRKGQRYGTILVDHEGGTIVDLLPDRTPERLAEWLRAHPGVEIVTRDRAEAYAQGITQGAPDAVQVADRWHLIKNVSDAVASVLHDHRSAIQRHLGPARGAPSVPASTRAMETVDPPSAATAEPTSIPLPKAPTQADRRRQDRAQQAHTLHARGWSQKAIAAHLQCHPRTVRRYLQRALPLPAREGSRRSNLDPYKPQLLQRWNEGCRNATQLWHEIAAAGFPGRISVVRSFVASLRVLSGMPARSRRAAGSALPVNATARVPSSRELAWLSTRPADALDEDQRALLGKLGAVDPTIKSVLELGQSFAAMVRQRQPDRLEAWLERATQSGIGALRSVAQGLRNDLAAVRAALTLCWSNGRTEGSVNRLKCVKRAMYGRGQLDLLRVRLCAT